jgi:hypothetical protein
MELAVENTSTDLPIVFRCRCLPTPPLAANAVTLYTSLCSVGIAAVTGSGPSAYPHTHTLFPWTSSASVGTNLSPGQFLQLFPAEPHDTEQC